ncbi:MAG: DUF2189 domain-containing protein [Paracoccaceae bacterium]
MVKTIGNPLSWGAKAFGATARYLTFETEHIGGGRVKTPPEVRSIGLSDISHALRKGVEDFTTFRSDVIFIVFLYPIIGLCMAWLAFNANLVHYVFPLAAGFALVGPLAAIGLFEMSRRREMGRETGWSHVLGVLHSPSIGPIVVMGVYLLLLFVIWMAAANYIHSMTMGPEPAATPMAFLHDMFATRGGWAMIAIQIPVGFVFAAVVLVISVVSFPLMLEHDIGLPMAVVTSVRVARRNPVTIAAWGLIVAVGLALGSLPLFLGLIVVMPILGHANWHLYRRAVVVK